MRHTLPATLVASIAIVVVNSIGNAATILGPVPRPVAYASVALALVGLAGAFGLWQLKRWGAFTTAGALVVTAVLAAPGIGFASAAPLQVIATVTVLLDLAGLALLFKPASRRAYGSHSAAVTTTEPAVPTR